MKIFMIVLGVLLILSGISCFATPLLTFIGAGYMLVILLLVYGIVSIIRGIESKNYGINFIYGILSVVLGVLIICIPALRVLTAATILCIMAGWFILKGIVSIYTAVKTKEHITGSMWIWGVVSGVLSILIGIYSAAHPLVLVFTVEMLVAMYFIISGVNMIAMGMQYEEQRG